MNKPTNTGVKRIIKATAFSWAGLRAAWRHEAAFREETIAVLLLIPIAIWLGNSPAQQALLIASVWLVLIVELLNSAVEAIVDRIGTDHHELSGRAKDLGSAAVLLSLLLTVIVWGLIGWARFGPQ